MTGLLQPVVYSGCPVIWISNIFETAYLHWKDEGPLNFQKIANDQTLKQYLSNMSIGTTFGFWPTLVFAEQSL